MGVAHLHKHTHTHTHTPISIYIREFSPFHPRVPLTLTQSNVLEPPSPTPPSPLDDSAMVTRVRNLEDRCIGCLSACDQATRDCTALRQVVPPHARLTLTSP